MGTWELVSEPPSILTFLSSWETRASWSPSLTSTTYKSEVSMESIPRPMMVSSISPTSEDSVEMKSTLSKTCTMVSKHSSRKRRNCEHNDRSQSSQMLC